MKTFQIVFICGSLQSGKDGVGDYTRKITSECIKLGHKASIIAFNDKGINSTIFELQKDNGLEIGCLRIAANQNEKEKILAAKKFVDEQNPDWLSLQFVPFSFHPKGLHLKLGVALKEIGGKRKWHIMFHEIWVGIRKNTSLKVKFWGQLQKLLIIQLLKQINPTITTAASTFYCRKLSPFVYNHHKLPLFSNIPLAIINPSAKKENNPKKKEVKFIIFGGVHGGGPVDQFIQNVHNSYSQSATLQLLGRNGNSSVWVEQWKKYDMPVEILGELPDQQISYLLSEGDYGISTTPFILSEKSGSIAAMLLHSLPIINVADQFSEANEHSTNEVGEIPGIYTFSPDKKLNFSDIKPDSSFTCTAVNIAKEMIRLMDNS